MCNSKKYEFSLEPYKGPRSKTKCPGCGYEGVYKKYISLSLGSYLSDLVGRCDREDSCGYHYTPKQYFIDNPEVTLLTDSTILQDTTNTTTITSSTNITNSPIQYIPFEVFNKSMMGLELSNLYPFLKKIFTEALAVKLCGDYFIGANRARNTVFWQVDINAKVRQAKVMQYNSETGRRNKETKAFFAGRIILNDPEANLKQCLFGEYQLSLDEHKEKPVAICESEKTAVIASVYYPEYVWLATGGKNGARWTEANVCRVLKGKNVVMFPDLGAYDQWKMKSKLLANVAECKVGVSEVLEKVATAEEKAKGLDLADYLLRNNDGSGLALTDDLYPLIWDTKYLFTVN